MSVLGRDGKEVARMTRLREDLGYRWLDTSTGISVVMPHYPVLDWYVPLVKRVVTRAPQWRSTKALPTPPSLELSIDIFPLSAFDSEYRQKGPPDREFYQDGLRIQEWTEFPTAMDDMGGIDRLVFVGERVQGGPPNLVVLMRLTAYTNGKGVSISPAFYWTHPIVVSFFSSLRFGDAAP